MADSDAFLVPFQQIGPEDEEFRARDLPLDLKAPLRRCPSCGTQDESDVVVCVRCGHDFRVGRRLEHAQEEQARDSQRRVQESGGRELWQLTRLAWTALSPLGIVLGPYVFARTLKAERRMRAYRAPASDLRQVQQARLLGVVGMVAWLLVFVGIGVLVRGSDRGGAALAVGCRHRLEDIGRVLRERVSEGPFPSDGNFPAALGSLVDGDAGLDPRSLSCPVDQDLYGYKRRSKEVLTVDTPGDYLVLWDDPAYPHSDEVGVQGFRALRFDGTVETFRARSHLEEALTRDAYGQTTASGPEGKPPGGDAGSPTGSGNGKGKGKGRGVSESQAGLFLDFAGECDDEDPDLNQFIEVDFFMEKVGVPADVLLPVLMNPSTTDRVREAAARMLVRVELPTGLKEKLASAASKDPLVGVRLCAGLTLQQVGNAEWLPVLAGVAEQGEPQAEAIVSRVLGREAIKSKKTTREILVLAAETRRRMGATGDDAIFPLPSGALGFAAEFLTSPTMGREAEAVFYSAGVEGQEALLKIVGSPDRSLRKVAYRCLDKLRGRGIVALAEYLDLLSAEGDVELRSEGIRGLSRGKGEPPKILVDWALTGLRSGRGSLDRPCRKIIARVGLPDAQPPSRHAEGVGWLLEDLSREGELGGLLAELGASGRLLDDELDEQIERRWSKFRLAAKRGLARLVAARLNPASLWVLLKGAADEDPEIRALCLKGMLKSGAPQTKKYRKAVGRLLSSRLRAETDAKARAILFRLAAGIRYCSVGEKGRDHKCDSALFRQLKSLSQDQDLRAMKTLTAHPTQPALGVFLEMLSAGDEEYAVNAAGALRALTGHGMQSPDPVAWARTLQNEAQAIRLKLQKETARQREAIERADAKANQRLEQVRQSR
jgi:hypothetical protein